MSAEAEEIVFKIETSCLLCETSGEVEEIVFKMKQAAFSLSQAVRPKK
jgi:hypothetical protein